MKYLLFNVIVVAALVYLFVGGGPSDPVEDWLPENVNTVISDVRERFTARRDDDAPADAQPRQVPSAVQPTGPVVPASPAVVDTKLPAPAAPAQSATATPSISVPDRLDPPAILPPSDDPPGPAQVRVDQPVPSAGPPARAATPEVEGPMMSPQERRRELQRLAETMELFAVEKISR